MIILCGESGTGKTAIRRALLNEGLSPLVSYTTRPMRPGEEDGVDYHFVDNMRFEAMRRNGDFIETTQYDTPNSTWRYGTPIGSTDNVVAIMNPIGLKKFKSIPNSLIVYVKCPPSIRMRRSFDRGDDYDTVMRRLQRDDDDFYDMEYICDMSIVNDGRFSLEEIAMIIKSAGVVHGAIR